jgi:hypothetical protein
LEKRVRIGGKLVWNRICTLTYGLTRLTLDGQYYQQVIGSFQRKRRGSSFDGLDHIGCPQVMGQTFARHLDNMDKINGLAI